MIGFTDWLAVLFLVTVALNILHWRFRVAEQFLYFPTSGILAAVNVAMYLAMLATALLSLARMVPGTLFIVVGISYVEATQVYSIWIRHCRRRTCAGKQGDAQEARETGLD